MPLITLTERHKKFIVDSSEFFFDKPETKSQFWEKFDKIKAAFANQLPATDSYYNFQLMFHEPEKVFLNLENADPLTKRSEKKENKEFKTASPIEATFLKYGDVQTCFLDFSIKNIKNLAAAHGLSFDELKWNVEPLKKKAQTNEHKAFVSKKSNFNTDGFVIREVMSPPGRIFNYFLYEDTDSNPWEYKTKVDIKSSMINKSGLIVPLKENVPLIKRDEEQDQFYIGQLPNALKISAKKTGDVAFQFLRSKNFISFSQKKEMCGKKEAFKNLLTYSFYFEGILNKQLNVVYLLRLTAPHLTTLADLKVIALLKNEILEISTLKNLTKIQIEVITYLLERGLLKKASPELNAIVHAGNACHVLLTPAVLNLLQAKVSNIHEALKLRKSIISVAQLEPYYSALITKKLDRKIFFSLRDSQLEILKHEKIINLINLGVITINDAILMPDATKVFIFKDEIYKAVSKKQISYSVLNNSFAQALFEKNYLCLNDLSMLIDTNQPEIKNVSVQEVLLQLGSQSEGVLKKLLQDFLNLARQKLVFINDLEYLMLNFKDMVMPIDEKITKSPLLVNKNFYSRVALNFYERIVNVINKKPITFKDGPDSIQKINSDFCNVREIMPNPIEVFFDNCIHEFIENGFDKKLLPELFEMGKKLELSLGQTLGTILAARFHRHYIDSRERMDDLKDSAKKIFDDFISLSKEFSIPIEETRYFALKKLLKKIQNSLTETLPEGEIYHLVYTSIQTAEKNELKSNFIIDKMIAWSQTCEKLITFVKTEIPKITTKNSYIKEGNKRRKTMSLFQPSESGKNPKMIMDFCERLSNLSTFLRVEQEVKPNPSI